MNGSVAFHFGLCASLDMFSSRFFCALPLCIFIIIRMGVVIQVECVRFDKQQKSFGARMRWPVSQRRAIAINRRLYLDYQRRAVVNLTDMGLLQGSVEMTKWTKKPIYRFLGIKYAESPSGNRRFKVITYYCRYEALNNANSENVEIVIRHRFQLNHGKVYEVPNNMVKVVQHTKDLQKCQKQIVKWVTSKIV